jgi:ubiquinone/menaquinone biosynthesis C-methylase UbiE
MRTPAKLWNEQFLPRWTNWTLTMEETRARVCAGLSGDVVEIGFGSGRNLPHMPREVERFYAVEPSEVAIDLAIPRIQIWDRPISLVGTDARQIRLPDSSVDRALVTWSLCSIPSPERALSEIRRVLRPGGALHFVEHGRSPEPKIARRQARFNPVWGTLMGGCKLDNPVDRMLADAGFEFERLDTYLEHRHQRAFYLYEGIARV